MKYAIETPVDDMLTIQFNALRPNQGATSATPTKEDYSNIWCFIFTMQFTKYCRHNTRTSHRE